MTEQENGVNEGEDGTPIITELGCRLIKTLITETVS